MAPPAHKKRKLFPPPVGNGDNGVSHNLDSEGSSVEDSKVAKGTTSTQSSLPTRKQGRHCSTPAPNGAYNSSMFQLQVDELLSEVRSHERRMIKAENALRKLKSIIERIPNRERKAILQAEREQHDSHTVRIPFPNPRPEKDARYMLAYSKPANINVVGSYARKTAIQVGDQLGIDLAVTMPSSVFQEKDYLNYRYFHKRAYYLACIATAIEEAEKCTFVINYIYQNDNHLQPIIAVSAGDGDDDFSRSKCQIRIILAAEGATFPLSKTLPNKNCIRLKAEGSTSNDRTTMPTPFYNASLRSECSSLAYLKHLHGASLQSNSFADACVLGSVWLRQRGMGTGLASGGLGAFEWACMMALLLQGGGPKGKPMLSKGYSSYQLFQATLQFLSMTDLVAKPVLVEANNVDVSAPEHPVLFDGARGMNILFKMTPWSYAMLRHAASSTLKLQNDPLSDHFDACFIASLNDPKQRFGRIVLLPLRQLRASATQTVDAISDDMAFCRQAYQVLKTGLGDRVSLIHMKPPGKPAWSPASSKQHPESTSRIQIGLLLNPEQVNRTVDRGPSVEDKEEAAAFRRFWGEKAELRRFKDGSIQESLIWSRNDPRENVLEQIVTYIIRRHIIEDIKGA